MDEDNPFIGYPAFRQAKQSREREVTPTSGLMAPVPQTGGGGRQPPNPEHLLGLLSMVPGVGNVASAIQTVPYMTGEKKLKGGLQSIAEALPYMLPKGQYFRNIVTTAGRATENALPMGRDPRGRQIVYNPDQHFKLRQDVAMQAIDRYNERKTPLVASIDELLLPGSELLQKHPELSKMRAEIGFNPELDRPHGAYWPDIGYIETEAPTFASRNPHGVQTVLLHELNHAANHLTGLSGGSNPGLEMEKLIVEAINSDKPINEDIIRSLAMHNYHSTQGEVFSRLSQKLYEDPTAVDFLRSVKGNPTGMMDIAPGLQRYKQNEHNFWDSQYGKEMDLMKALKGAYPWETGLLKRP